LKGLIRSAKNAVVGKHNFAEFISTDAKQLQFVDIETEMLGQVKKEEKAAPPPKKTPMPGSEVAKAGKAIGLDPKDNPKLAKILNDEPRHKWAAALGKLATTLKLKETDGKKLVLLLNKVDSIRKAQLIDL
jgi:hypothetical protein